MKMNELNEGAAWEQDSDVLENDADQQIPNEGQFVEPELPEEYKGKSIQEVVDMHRQSVQKMTEATESAANVRRDMQNMQTQYDMDMARFNSSQAQNKIDPAIEGFRSKVNPDDDVLNSVTNLSKMAARQALEPELQSLSNQTSAMKQQMYEMARSSYYASDPEAKVLHNDIVKAGGDVGGIIYQHLQQAGLKDLDINKVFNGINYDARLLPFLKATARGFQPSDYFANSKPKVDLNEGDKKDLGGGGSATPTNDGVLANDQFDTLSPDKQRSYLKKQGLL